MEIAIHDFCSRMAGQLTPAVELARFEVTQNGSSCMYPVLISETIEGSTLAPNISVSWNACDQKQWTWMFLCTILIRPADGRSANYVFGSNGRIYCIDNDMPFVAPYESSRVQFSSVLFCLFPTVSLNEEVLKEFVALDPGPILHAWVDNMIAIEKQYDALFTPVEQEELFNRRAKSSAEGPSEFTSNLLFRPGTISTLNLQFLLLQSLIRKKEYKLTPLDLLENLILITDEAKLLSIGKNVKDAYVPTRLPVQNLDQRLGQILSRKVEQSLPSKRANQACLGIQKATYTGLKGSKTFSSIEAREELLSTFLSTQGNDLNYNDESIHGNFENLSRLKQNLILTALQTSLENQNNKPRRITLQHCSELKSPMLTSFLHNDLVSLDLSYSSINVPEDINAIAQKCLHLADFKLVNCSILKLFAANTEWIKLQTITLDECDNLEKIQLTAPLLKKLSFNQCPKIKLTEIKAKVFNRSKLSTSPVFDMSKIEEINIDDWFKTHVTWVRADREVAKAAVVRDPSLWKWIDKGLRKDREVAMAAVLRDLSSRELIDREWRKDREDPSIWELIDKELRKDIKFLTTIVCQQGLALRYTKQRHKSDLEFVIKAVFQNGLALKFANKKLRNKKVVVKTAVQQNGMALRYADKRWRKDPATVLTAVTQNGMALQYADDSQRRNPVIISAAIAQDPRAMQYAME